MKYVIYKELDSYKVTDVRNFRKTMRDAHEIMDFSQFQSIKIIKDFVRQYDTNADFVIDSSCNDV